MSGLAIIFRLFAAATAGCAVAAAASGGPPPAPRNDVVDTVSGHAIPDPYRWLEDGASPATTKWVADQIAYTRSILDPLPGREAIHKRLSQLLQIGSITAPRPGGQYYFYTRREGLQNQPVLYVREGLHGPDRTLVDVNQLAADGTIALDWWYPAHDGRFVAYGTSPSGSELSTLHIIETASGRILPDTIERTRAASVAWLPDDSGFYYTRYPKPGDVPAGQEVYNRHVFFHVMGKDPREDREIFGSGRDPQDWPNVELSEDGRWLTIGVEQGWAKSELFLLDTKTGGAQPVRLSDGSNNLFSATPWKDDLYIMTNQGAPRYRVFKTSATAPDREHWREIIPQNNDVLTGISIIGGRLFTTYEHVATDRIRIFKTDGSAVGEIPLPGLGSLAGVEGLEDRSEAFFAFQSFNVPPTVYRYDQAVGASEVWARISAPVDPADYNVDQVSYSSRDGTKVPMFIVSKKGAPRGVRPALLTGYGGFNVSEKPAFSRSAFLWLESGGVYAVANLRGGSEFGEDWHRAGMLANKQNVFDDFIAAGEYLIARQYTDKQHLAIMGGSNGGLLVGAAVTERPDLWKAAVCAVPLLDMLRYQQFQIARLWIPEYGTADNPDQFQFLYAYSPYHHVRKGIEYPAVLFTTADTDTRVDPMHARKMTALLQAEAANGHSTRRPILLRVETKAGHGAGKPITKQIDELTDVYSFVMWQTGLQPLQK